MKILAIGDVVGQAGVAYLRANLRNIKQKYSADLVIVNGVYMPKMEYIEDE